MDGDASSASYIQAERILRIETPLGADVLLPEHVEMREAVNDLFTLHVAVRSKKTDIKPNEIVGKLVDVSLELGQGERRTWNGLVVRLVEGPPVTRGMRSYQLEIRPQHWLMSQRSDCRIWQDKTSLDVARTLLSEHKLQAPVTSGVIPEPKPQHYSVQYNETDIAYLLRRLEEDGLFFWFEHEGGSAGSVASDPVPSGSARPRRVLAPPAKGLTMAQPTGSMGSSCASARVYGSDADAKRVSSQRTRGVRPTTATSPSPPQSASSGPASSPVHAAPWTSSAPTSARRSRSTDKAFTPAAGRRSST